MKINIFFTIFFSTMSILLADPPDWQDDPGAYEFVATIAGGIIQSDGVNMAEEGDIFAAFDESGNVRGVAVQLVPSFGPYEGEIIYLDESDASYLHYKREWNENSISNLRIHIGLSSIRV